LLPSKLLGLGLKEKFGNIFILGYPQDLENRMHLDLRYRTVEEVQWTINH
jgi:hypothetical protein